MDVIMCTSRGRHLKKYFEHSINPPTIITRPGSSIHHLTEEAVSIIEKHDSEPENIHVYFLAGLTDITEKIADQNYQEVIFIDSPVDANHKLEVKYYESSNKIK